MTDRCACVQPMTDQRVAPGFHLPASPGSVLKSGRLPSFPWSGLSPPPQPRCGQHCCRVLLAPRTGAGPEQISDEF